MSHSVATYTGRLVSLENPGIDDIDEIDIAHHLANINRYNGATRDGKTWSVAAHSLLVAFLAADPEVYPYALLHDAHEAYCQDIVSPLRKYVEHIVGYDVFHAISDPFDEMIAEYFGIEFPWPAGVKEAVKLADMKAYAIEKKLFLNPTPEWPVKLPEIQDAIPMEIIALAGRPELARDWFLNALMDLRERHAPRMDMVGLAG